LPDTIHRADGERHLIAEGIKNNQQIDQPMLGVRPMAALTSKQGVTEYPFVCNASATS
jgi:hypothetical protein